ncbi:unnamed protein product [Phytophthora lilii]|uniref:Unnamed protein product n=1 Tax=Phytophthora lilii TaxID=2077276 RepID=A0A9W6YKV6_9STRA|nr:unnamed protein product [Phytophthora lilii]
MNSVLASCDLVSPQIPLSLREFASDDQSESSVTVTKKRVCKKSTIDPVVRRELDRIKDRKRCSTYRARQRNKRASLQLELQELMTTLAELKKVKSNNVLVSKSVWELLAQQQLQERLESERQQLRLCEAVQARAVYIRQFQDMVQQRIVRNLVQINVPPYEELAKKYEACGGAAFFDLFVQDLDAIHSQTDDNLQVFEQPTTWKEDDDTGCFLFVEKQEFTCDFDQACQTLWRAAQLPHRQQDRVESLGVPDPSNTTAFKFRVLRRLSSGQVVSAAQRVICRRYQTSDRMVFVWQSYMDGEGMFAGLRAGETGWDVLARSTDSSGVVRVTRTSCICHSPMRIEGLVTREPAVKQFNDMLIGAVTEDGNEITKRFETLEISEVQSATARVSAM